MPSRAFEGLKMQIYSVYVTDFVVVEAEDPEDAAQQAKEWLKELLETDELSFDVVEGDESEGDEEEEPEAE
jgi:predicted RNase H-like HicB family nuclease